MWVYRLPVHIAPVDCTVFTEICGEFVTTQRADVGIGPYTRRADAPAGTEKLLRMPRHTEERFLLSGFHQGTHSG